MASGDRFYLMEFRHREVLNGDVGSLLRIDGLVVGGGGAQKILMLPGTQKIVSLLGNQQLIRGSQFNLQESAELTLEEWSDWLRRSDDPEILVGLRKIFQRKVRYEISGAVQQKIWAADGFACVYCGAQMGKVLMTIDHLVPLELDGKNDPSNYVTACKPCNKDKGSENPDQWLARRGKTLSGIQQYVENRKL